MVKSIKETSNHAVYIVLSVFMAIALVGCGGMMGTETSATRSGSFVDSPVQGLHYQTETQEGITDEDGTFFYMPGETVTFSIGDTVLGRAEAESVMTPLHLVEGAEDEMNTAVTNMGMLMQSLDEDGDTDNGITISIEMTEMMTDMTIDFNLDNTDFQNNEDMLEMFDTMNEMELFENGERMMVTPDEAQEHMRQYMMPHMNTSMGQDMGSGMMM